jgi:transposase
MRFTQVRTIEQIDVQALHRMRDQLVSSRTRLVNQARAFCLEYGIAMRQGIGTFRIDLPRVLADGSNDLSAPMRQMLAEILDDIGHVDQRISSVTRQIEALADREDRARRLMTIPGIGPMAATALLAAVGDGRQFRRARELAAWLGLTPREHSTGGKTTLLGISKRGNRYVRKLLVHGARSCITHMNRTKDRIGDWLDALESRMHVNKVTVALAAKMARMAWAIIVRPGALYDRRDPTVA